MVTTLPNMPVLGEDVISLLTGTKMSGGRLILRFMVVEN